MNNSKIPGLLLWTYRLALLCLVMLPLAILCTRLNLVHFSIGLAVSALACIGAILIMFLSITAWFLPKFKPFRASSQKTLLLTIAPVLIALNAIASGGNYPAIHDVSTDTKNPPLFIEALNQRGSNSNSLEIVDKVLQSQLEAYPHLVPISTSLSPMLAFQKSLSIARNLGWDVYNTNIKTGVIEAVDTTLLYGFKDDIAIRILSQAGNTRVDLRSVSRVGVGDIGANAHRIETFINQFNNAQ